MIKVTKCLPNSGPLRGKNRNPKRNLKRETSANANPNVKIGDFLLLVRTKDDEGDKVSF